MVKNVGTFYGSHSEFFTRVKEPACKIQQAPTTSNMPPPTKTSSAYIQRLHLPQLPQKSN